MENNQPQSNQKTDLPVKPVIVEKTETGKPGVTSPVKPADTAISSNS